MSAVSTCLSCEEEQQEQEEEDGGADSMMTPMLNLTLVTRLNLMLVIRLKKVDHQKLIFCLLQVLSSQTRVELLLCLRADFLFLDKLDSECIFK